MNICFVLPGYTRQPIGGFKMVYEYTNRFLEYGHQVTLLCINENIMNGRHIPFACKKMIANYLTEREPRWFCLDNRAVKISGLKSVAKSVYLKTDVAIATSVDTVQYTKSNFLNTPKAYFIQGYENWGERDDYCKKTYRFGLKNIVVSNWLKDIVLKESGIEPTVIRNPIDTDIYRVKKTIDQREKHTIGLLYHKMENKGFKYSLDALYSLKNMYPDLKVKMFGVPRRPNGLPEWFEYHQSIGIDQTVDIYNSVSIWMCSSIDEGYGLTGLEAMACGAALVSTAYQGVFEYAKNGENCLLSPVKNISAMVKNVDKLFRDEQLLRALSANGVQTSKQFTMDASASLFEKTLKSMKVNYNVESSKLCKQNSRSPQC